METIQKVRYEVRFVCYQYNGGGSIRNGNVRCEINCLTLEEAIAKSKDVKLTLAAHLKGGTTNSREFASQYVWDGYVSSYDGIYKIIEEKVHV